MRPGDLLEQRYRLVRVLGRGRSGSVWCARNELIDRAVAVKILHRSLASDPERLQRFFQEARACGRVRHPSVVEVLDLGQGDEGILFLVMELLEGETMASLLGRKGRLSVDEALALVIPLAHGLAAAHAHGILHRDLKPANIYLHKTPTGSLQPKILDFGISKIIGNDVTATGVVLGTPSYMSPEQARGVPDLDPRTDVWSLGVILYEALTGRLPFVAKEYRALVDEIIERKHVPVEEVVPEVPADVARVVDEALEKSRDRRLPSAAQMAHRLTTILRSRGRGELLRDPDDEFSEGAPTLARDREKMGLPGPSSGPSNIDDTVGDHTPLAAAKPEGPKPAPAIANTTKPGVGLARTQGGVQPSAATLALAALTSGSKRHEPASAPRPAAGAPAKPKQAIVKDDPDATRPPVRIENAPEETRPDPLPLANKKEKLPHVARPPEPAHGVTTQSWEVSAAQAASGRAEVILGTGAIPPIQVNQDWDTTVADVAAGDITEKGPLPKLAPPPVMSDPPPAKENVPTSSHRALKKSPATQTADERPASRRSVPPSGRKETPIGAIPGFNAPPPAHAPPPPSITPATPALQARTSTRPPSTPPPPRSSPAPALSRQPTARNKPPRPPPKSTPPPGNAFSGMTLRPGPSGMHHPEAHLAEPMPLLSADLYALGDRPVEQPFELTRSDPKSDTNGHGHVIPSGTNPNIETDKRRLGPSLVPLMIAAVAVLFFFGIVVGTVAASRGGDAHYVRRFAAGNAVLAEWHDHAEKIARLEMEKAEAEKAKPPEPEPTPPPAPTPTTTATQTAAPPPQPPPVATATAPKPVSTAPKPITTAKPTTTSKPTTTGTSKGPTKTAPTSTSTKKGTGDGNKEWWQKKF
jgi:eukaryotic-like serine/threonine-protein kinase